MEMKHHNQNIHDTVYICILLPSESIQMVKVGINKQN